MIEYLYEHETIASTYGFLRHCRRKDGKLRFRSKGLHTFPLGQRENTRVASHRGAGALRTRGKRSVSEVEGEGTEHPGVYVVGR